MISATTYPTVEDLKYLYGCDLANELRDAAIRASFNSGVHVAPGDFTNAGTVRITAFRRADARLFTLYGDDFDSGYEALELAHAFITAKAGV